MPDCTERQDPAIRCSMQPAWCSSFQPNELFLTNTSSHCSLTLCRRRRLLLCCYFWWPNELLSQLPLAHELCIIANYLLYQGKAYAMENK